MNNSEKLNLVLSIAILVLVVVVGVFVFSFDSGSDDIDVANLGAVGTNPVENYIPIIKFNDGYYSEKDITTTGTLTAAIASISGAFSAATTTLSGPLTVGGDACTLTDADGGAVSLTEELLQRCSYFTMAAGGAGQEVIQLTPVATTSLTSFLATAGQCKSFIYDSSALAAGTTTTHTETAGHIIIAPTANDDLIDGGEYSQMELCRRPDSDITYALSAELVDAD